MPHGQRKQNINNRSTIVTDSVKSFQMVHVKKKIFFKSLIECQSHKTVLSIADTLLLGIQTQKEVLILKQVYKKCLEELKRGTVNMPTGWELGVGGQKSFPEEGGDVRKLS